MGTTPSYAGARNYSTQAGAFFTPDDEANHRRVVVLGQTVVADLFPTTYPVGQTITLNGVSFQVVGVLAPKGSNGAQDQDDVAMAPLTAVQDTLTGYGPVNGITVQATSAAAVTAASTETETILLQRHHIASARLPSAQPVSAAADLQLHGRRLHHPARGRCGHLAAGGRDRRSRSPASSPASRCTRSSWPSASWREPGCSSACITGSAKYSGHCAYRIRGAVK